MPQGFLSVRVYTARGAFPLSDASVSVMRTDNTVPPVASTTVSGLDFDYKEVTDENGVAGRIAIDAPSRALSYIVGSQTVPYATCDVYVRRDGYIPAIYKGVQIFAAEQSVLPVSLEPLFSDNLTRKNTVTDDVSGETVIYYLIPPPVVYTGERESAQPRPDTLASVDIARNVYVPEYISVHLGVPSDASADNVYVSFPEYIKNVASSEIYPSWPEDSIRANIHAQISLTLNRVFTEWYRSQGYSFQITNSIAFDQAYVDGRNIFANIERIVDDIFNTYIKRDRVIEPLFAAYCDGRSTRCNGLSQWGSVDLANEGLSPLGIVRFYYGQNVNFATATEIRGIEESYPGTPLVLGDNSEAVAVIQSQLQRIRRNYPKIPPIPLANGRFGTDTDLAVRNFQDIFSLSETGVVDRATWYKISYVYASVIKLAELASEGILQDISENIPNVTLQLGSSGDEVVLLQLLLSYIGYFYPYIPIISADSYFGQNTENAVREFQKFFGLESDGVVGQATWNTLFDVYERVSGIVTPTLPEQSFPGTLSLSSSGEAVRLLQEYLRKISESYPVIPAPAVDGVFGEQTRQSVLAFQKRFGLTQDGIVGRQTWNRAVELYNYLTASNE